jgi:hypothetical protein
MEKNTFFLNFFILNANIIHFYINNQVFIQIVFSKVKNIFLRIYFILKFYIMFF